MCNIEFYKRKEIGIKLYIKPSCLSSFPTECCLFGVVDVLSRRYCNSFLLSHRAICYIWHPALGMADRAAPAPPPPFPLAPPCSICSMADGAKCPIYDFHGLDPEPGVPVSASCRCSGFLLVVERVAMQASWYCSHGQDAVVQLTATNGRGTTLFSR